MITYIARKNGVTLWSFGNYEYEIEWKDGRSEKFSADYEEALERFERVA